MPKKSWKNSDDEDDDYDEEQSFRSSSKGGRGGRKRVIKDGFMETGLDDDVEETLRKRKKPKAPLPRELKPWSGPSLTLDAAASSSLADLENTLAKKHKKREPPGASINGVSSQPITYSSPHVPNLPFSTAHFTIISWGRVDRREAFHKQRYLFPLGYMSRTHFTSWMDPASRTVYTTEIREHNDRPLFVITADDDPDHPIEKDSASGAWTEVVIRIDENRPPEHRRATYSVSGPFHMGLSHPEVVKALTHLPGAQQVSDFDPTLAMNGTTFVRGKHKAQKSSTPTAWIKNNVFSAPKQAPRMPMLSDAAKSKQPVDGISQDDWLGSLPPPWRKQYLTILETACPDILSSFKQAIASSPSSSSPLTLSVPKVEDPTWKYPFSPHMASLPPLSVSSSSPLSDFDIQKITLLPTCGDDSDPNPIALQTMLNDEYALILKLCSEPYPPSPAPASSSSSSPLQLDQETESPSPADNPESSAVSADVPKSEEGAAEVEQLEAEESVPSRKVRPKRSVSAPVAPAAPKEKEKEKEKADKPRPEMERLDSAALLWVFFKRHLLCPLPHRNPLARLARAWINLFGSSPDILWQWVCHPITRQLMPLPPLLHSLYQPKSLAQLRAEANKSEEEQAAAQSEENEELETSKRRFFLWYAALIGDDRRADIGFSRMPGLENELGMFAREHCYAPGRDFLLYADHLHGVCFEIPPHVADMYESSLHSVIGRDKGSGHKTPHIMFGPISLINHHCSVPITFAEDSGNDIYLCWTKPDWVFDQGDEIYVNYGKDFFNGSKILCVCGCRDSPSSSSSSAPPISSPPDIKMEQQQEKQEKQEQAPAEAEKKEQHDDDFELRLDSGDESAAVSSSTEIDPIPKPKPIYDSRRPGRSLVDHPLSLERAHARFLYISSRRLDSIRQRQQQQQQQDDSSSASSPSTGIPSSRFIDASKSLSSSRIWANALACERATAAFSVKRYPVWRFIEFRISVTPSTRKELAYGKQYFDYNDDDNNHNNNNNGSSGDEKDDHKILSLAPFVLRRVGLFEVTKLPYEVRSPAEYLLDENTIRMQRLANGEDEEMGQQRDADTKPAADEEHAEQQPMEGMESDEDGLHMQLVLDEEDDEIMQKQGENIISPPAATVSNSPLSTPPTPPSPSHASNTPPSVSSASVPTPTPAEEEAADADVAFVAAMKPKKKIFAKKTKVIQDSTDEELGSSAEEEAKDDDDDEEEYRDDEEEEEYTPSSRLAMNAKKKAEKAEARKLKLEEKQRRQEEKKLLREQKKQSKVSGDKRNNRKRNTVSSSLPTLLTPDVVAPPSFSSLPPFSSSSSSPRLVEIGSSSSQREDEMLAANFLAQSRSPQHYHQQQIVLGAPSPRYQYHPHLAASSSSSSPSASMHDLSSASQSASYASAASMFALQQQQHQHQMLQQQRQHALLLQQQHQQQQQQQQQHALRVAATATSASPSSSSSSAPSAPSAGQRLQMPVEIPHWVPPHQTEFYKQQFQDNFNRQVQQRLAQQQQSQMGGVMLQPHPHQQRMYAMPPMVMPQQHQHQQQQQQQQRHPSMSGNIGTGIAPIHIIPSQHVNSYQSQQQLNMIQAQQNMMMQQQQQQRAAQSDRPILQQNGGSFTFASQNGYNLPPAPAPAPAPAPPSSSSPSAPVPSTSSSVDAADLAILQLLNGPSRQ